jgi:hypothetical protein
VETHSSEAMCCSQFLLLWLSLGLLGYGPLPPLLLLLLVAHIAFQFICQSSAVSEPCARLTGGPLNRRTSGPLDRWTAGPLDRWAAERVLA